MRNKNKSKKLLLLMSIVFIITIGYAYLTATLNINCLSSIFNPTWNVYFDNVVVNTDSVDVGEPVIDTNKTIVTYSVHLSKPGDFYEFTIDVVNDGSIDAMIESISSRINNVEIDNLPDYLVYTVTYDDGLQLEKNQLLSANDFETYKIHIGYKDDISSSQLPDVNQNLSMSFSVNYVQANRDATLINHLTLYNVFKKSFIEETSAVEYTGEHHDSFIEEPSKKIYYWGNNLNGALEMNNVIFGGFCWQMYRTTDTGGVKIIYNGVPNEGKCVNTAAAQTIGDSKFNDGGTSLADVGYMYNKRYLYDGMTLSYDYVYNNRNLSTSYWYADSYSYDEVTNNYTLVNPYQVSSKNDYPSLQGKYTFLKSDENASNSYVYYIRGVDGSFMYPISISSGHDLSYFDYTFTYGTSYTKNNDGSYRINNPSQMSLTSFYSNYNSLKEKYVCKYDLGDACSELWYVPTTSKTYLGRVLSTNNYKFANGFTYDNVLGKYILNNDSITFWDIKKYQGELNSHHYTCLNESGECDSVSYIYYLNTSNYQCFYINLNDGKNINDALNEMLFADDVNTNSSVIKRFIDSWYEENMLGYTSFLEDTVFCVDRKIKNYNGWDPNGGSVTNYISFNGSNKGLTCSNITDRFSIYNNKAKLTYPVGMLSKEEASLNLSGVLNNIGKSYWLINPNYLLSYSSIHNYNIDRGNGLVEGSSVSSSRGVRPMVSLKPGTIYVAGDGSKNDPYVVE